MALIVCPACQKQYSDTLDQCPHCQFTPKVFVCPECNNLCSLSSGSCSRCGYEFLNVKLEPAKMEAIEKSYQDCLIEFDRASSLSEWEALSQAFEVLGNYKDSQVKGGACHNRVQSLKAEKSNARTYSEATSIFEKSTTSEEMQTALGLLTSLGDFRDAKEKIPEYAKKLESLKADESEAERERLYSETLIQIENAVTQENWSRIVETLSDIGKYKDAPEKLECCRQQLKAIVAKKKKKKMLIVSTLAAAIIIIALAKFLIIPAVDYKNGVANFETGNYSKATELFQAARNYKDATERAITSGKAQSYKDGEALFQSKKYVDAIDAFKSADDYKDAKSKISAVAISAIQNKQYRAGINALANYTDEKSVGYVAYANGMLALDSNKYAEAEDYFNKALNIEDGAEKAKLAYFKDAEVDYAAGNLNSALEKYKMLPENYSSDNITVADRLNVLYSHSTFVAMCGKWQASGNCTMKVRQTGSYGYWNEWTADNPDPSQNIMVRCVINSDGTVNVTGNLEYSRCTNYSPISAGLNYTTDDKAFTLNGLTSAPNGVTIASNLTLTYSNGSYKAYYSKSDNTEDVYFTYLYTSSYTYGNLIEQY